VVEQEQRLQQALRDFLGAFENLCLPSFMAAFAEDATVFFPFAKVPLRANGAQEIEKIFAEVFESRRSREMSGPPYLNLDPADLRIVIDGSLALVSFHLHDSDDDQRTLCRRTLVWMDDGVRWRILHLHASNIAVGRDRSGRLS